MIFFDFFDFSLLLICITCFGDEDMTIKVYQGHLFHLTSPGLSQKHTDNTDLTDKHRFFCSDN